MKELISIITINFQNSKGLDETIKSVVSQTYSNFEYIIIDGGSTDGSVEIIESYKDHITYWESEKDKGIYSAMNKGWKVATGDYCMFLNSGDYLYNDSVIQSVVDKINENSADIIFGNLFAFDENQSWVSDFLEPISLYYFHHNFIPHPSTFTKRVLLERLNGFYEHYSIISDWAFFINCLIANASFNRIDVTTTAFYMQGASSNGDKSLAEKKKLFENEFKFLSEDFKNFERLRHFDTSIVTRLARSISTLKMKYLGCLFIINYFY